MNKMWTAGKCIRQLYASQENDFAEAAGREAQKLQKEMAAHLK